ncbi:hypothetical protein FE634_00940 [Nocardioides dongxiaopingii]|uniref:hypothetical protein n=1 Tax=Nocardioides sp. S-1144 TaxID=2582905 RepID=UPI00110DED92|nr:hypothetical protein [Nocardioides sp. S-1144]QCW49340.1 hypothetical protein FE634_00940 [Nocardioides sp. S-1144]
MSTTNPARAGAEIRPTPEVDVGAGDLPGRPRARQAAIDHCVGMTMLWCGPTLGFLLALLHCCRADG